MGTDHGVLFQEEDRQRRRSDQTDYDWYEQHPEEDVSAREAAFVRPLSRILPRLNLLGFTLDAAKAEYDELVRQELEIREELDPDAIPPRPMAFDEFCAFVSAHDLSFLDGTYIDSDTHDRDEVAKGRFRAHQNEIARIPQTENSDMYWSEQSYFGVVVCVLSPYAMLQVFGQNPSNADAEVMWQYGPIVDAGWVDLSGFMPMARRDQTILVVTEGSSDARILMHALHLLRADVADFFRFVDVEGSHPFWGTGNLVKFAEGLLRIDVHNQIVFVLDNDAEGKDALQRLGRLSFPSNMRAMMLPDLDDFRQFPAQGPEGIVNSDINGRAAAIECYLDLNLPGYPPAQVLWSNYKREVEAWQGALEHKETYMRRFLEQTRDGIVQTNYDTSKLGQVVNALIAEAILLFRGQADWPPVV